jgi:hypothetical protein
MAMPGSIGAGELPLVRLERGPDPGAARRVVRPFDPVAWAYLALNREGRGERAAQIRTIVEQLEADSAEPAAVAAIRERLTGAPVAPGRLAVFAGADGTVLHGQRLAESDAPDRAGCSAPADVLPLLACDQDRPPYVSVVIDRAGADLGYSRGGDDPEHPAVVEGTDDEIVHPATGGWSGWSQSRIQRRAMDSWQHNAHQVAERVAACAAHVRAQAIFVAGDARAVHFLLGRLPTEPGTEVRRVAGSRSADRAPGAHAARLRQALAEIAAVQTRQLLEAFDSRLDGNVAVDGATQTVAALSAGRVATLLVDPAVATRRSWFGVDATEVYLDHDEAVSFGRPVKPAALVLAAARSALLSGGRVRVLPAGTAGAPDEGIGALCRFAQAVG